MLLSQLTMVFCLAAAAEGAAAGSREVTPILADEGVFDWVLQESTGRLFASSPSKNSLVEYDPTTGQEVRRFAVPGTPQELVLKSHWLVVSCEASGTLQIIDLTANAVRGQVPLGGRGPCSLFCSPVDNSYIYAWRNRSEGQPNPQIVQVDIAAGVVKRRSDVTLEQQLTAQACLSTDGRWLVLRASAGYGSSDLTLLQVDEQAGSFRPIPLRKEQPGRITAIPGNRYWGLSSTLLSLDLSEVVRRYADEIVVHPQFDWAASVRWGPAATLIMQTFSGPRVLKTVTLGPLGPNVPSPAPPSPAPSRPAPARGLYLQFDTAGMHFVCAWGRQAYLVDLNRLGIPRQPLLLIAGQSDCRVTQGDELRLRPTLSNPQLLAETRFELVSGPTGARWHEGQVVWRPGPLDVDRHWLEVRAVRGAQQDTYRFPVQVEPHSVSLGFVARGVHLERAGRYAVCWGLAADREGGSQPADSASLDWALVDLEAPAVVHQERFLGGLDFLHVDDKYVYLCAAGGQLLGRVQRDDVRQRERLAPSRPVRAMFNLGRNLLGLSLSEREFQVIDRDTLQRVSSHPLDRKSDTGTTGPLEVGEGRLQVFEHIFDCRTDSHVCFVGFPRLSALLSSSEIRAMDTQSVWGRRVGSGELRSANGQAKIANWASTTDELAMAVSPEQPILVTLCKEQGGRAGLVLEVRELEAGSVLQSRLVLPNPEVPGSLGWPFRRCPLSIAGQRVAFCAGQRLVAVDLSADVLAKAPIPLHAKYPVVPEGDVTKPLEFRVTAAGGNGECQFYAVQEQEGIRIDRKTGDVTVDLPRLWDKYLAAFRVNPERDSFAMLIPLSERQKAYRDLTGRDLAADRIAFDVPLQFAVGDDQGQLDRVQVFAVVLAPRQPQQEIVDTHLKKREEATREAEQLRQMAARNPPPPANQEESLAELSKRARRLEPALEGLLNKLQAIEQRLDAPRVSVPKPAKTPAAEPPNP